MKKAISTSTGNQQQVKETSTIADSSVNPIYQNLELGSEEIKRTLSFLSGGIQEQSL